MVHNVVNKSEYNNPFVGSLIVNDMDFIKLCSDFDYYMRLSPKFCPPREDSIFAKQSGSPWYRHRLIKVPYPVMYLGDIEVHWIHERSEGVCLEKYNRRRLRYLATKPDNYFLLSYSEIMNNYKDIVGFIRLFLESNKNCIFLGPQKYEKHFSERYIVINRWDNEALVRDSSHIYRFNNQNLVVGFFRQYFI